MIRGTTPTLEFELPFDTNMISELWVTLAQNRKAVIDKPMNGCAISGRKIEVHLTQEDTLKLDSNYKTEIQVRVKTKAGDALASNIIVVNTDRILKDGVI